jgi:hypothetical protein
MEHGEGYIHTHIDDKSRCAPFEIFMHSYAVCVAIVLAIHFSQQIQSSVEKPSFIYKVPLPSRYYI